MSNATFTDGENDAETVNEVTTLEYAKQFTAVTEPSKRRPWWKFWSE